MIMRIGKMLSYIYISIIAGIYFLYLPTYATVVQPTDGGFGSAKVVIDNNVNIAGTDKIQENNLEQVIKGAVNWTLGILGLVALLVLLYGGFRMLTAAGNEEQYNSGFTYLKNAAIGLAIIGVAWFIVSLIFFVLNITTESAVGTSGGTVE